VIKINLSAPEPGRTCKIKAPIGTSILVMPCGAIVAPLDTAEFKTFVDRDEEGNVLGQYWEQIA
jgi:hypothetical protein